MEEISKATKIACKIIGYFSRVLLALFAFLFGATGIVALASAVIDKDFFGVIGCAACAFVAWVCWSVRRDINVDL